MRGAVIQHKSRIRRFGVQAFKLGAAQRFGRDRRGCVKQPDYDDGIEPVCREIQTGLVKKPILLQLIR